jgi:hypothetical protein
MSKKFIPNCDISFLHYLVRRRLVKAQNGQGGDWSRWRLVEAKNVQGREWSRGRMVKAQNGRGREWLRQKLVYKYIKELFIYWR